MFTGADGAGHGANRLSAQKLREAMDEESASYRRWLRGIIFFYFGLLLVSGVAVVSHSGTGRTQLTNLSVNHAATSARAD